MPRARISVDGIEIAKPGYDVDTAALENMLFSSSMVAMRIFETGTLNPTTTLPADDQYRTATVTFDDPFTNPPIVLVAGVYSDGTSDQSPFLWNTANGSRAWVRPYYQVQTYVDKFTLTVLRHTNIRPNPDYWRYWVFYNTLET